MTDRLTHALTHSLTHLLIYSFAHALILSLTHQVRTSNIMMLDDILEFKDLIEMQAAEKAKEVIKKRTAPVLQRERSVDAHSDGASHHPPPLEICHIATPL
jgi:hypothetical protein